jgi:hypothetical protein
MSFIEIAANEAFEEAGVISYISARNVQGTKAECKWAGSIRWVSCQAAAQHLHEPLLAKLCHRLGQKL